MSNEIVKLSHPEPSGNAGMPVDPVVFTPPIDIYETPDGLVLQADLPGVTLETLSRIRSAR